MDAAFGKEMAAIVLLSVVASLIGPGESKTQVALFNNYPMSGYGCQQANRPIEKRPLKGEYGEAAITDCINTVFLFKCETNGQCCSGCCQQAIGLCSSRNSDCWGSNVCSSITCPFPSICIVRPNGQPDCATPCHPDCPTGYMCKIFNNVYGPPYSKCVKDNPCQGMPCESGYVCEYVAGLSPWPPKCVPNPCAVIRCEFGFTCRLKPNSFPIVGECVRILDPCAAISCTPGYVCKTIPGSSPPHGRCVPSYSDPCLTVICSAGFTCQPQPNVFPPRGHCVPVPPDSCASLICQPGYSCVMQPGIYPPTPKCELTHPCATKPSPCEPSEICVEREVQCIRAPCPPVAECIRSNPCATKSCGSGYTCHIIETSCNVPPCYPVAECVLTNPCSTRYRPCKNYELCIEVDVQCFRAPCPRVAKCIPWF